MSRDIAFPGGDSVAFMAFLPNPQGTETALAGITNLYTYLFQLISLLTLHFCI